jgi:hypothetical protein
MLVPVPAVAFFPVLASLAIFLPALLVLAAMSLFSFRGGCRRLVVLVVIVIGNVWDGIRDSGTLALSKGSNLNFGLDLGARGRFLMMLV